MTSFNATARLAIAELIIYIILLPLVAYILFRHGKRGIDGWAFLVIFCILRIVSSAMQIANRTSITGSIINSVGVSAMLLALVGVIHEM
jgi:hypothetical membrane protein